MVLVSDQHPPHDDWLVRRITELEAKVRELQAGRRMEAATIGAGGLTIKAGGSLTVIDGQVFFRDGDGTLKIYFGPLDYGVGTPATGWLFKRDGGELVFSLEGIDPAHQFLAVRDRVGNIIISDDGASGQGLATPYIPGQFVPWSSGAPLDTTTSGTFTTLQKAIWRKQHPRFRAWMLTYVTATTGEVRFRINTGPNAGTVISGPHTVSGGPSYALYGPLDLPGTHLSEFEIDVDGRVASGAGLVGVRVITALGIQSP